MSAIKFVCNWSDRTESKIITLIDKFRTTGHVTVKDVDEATDSLTAGVDRDMYGWTKNLHKILLKQNKEDRILCLEMSDEPVCLLNPIYADKKEDMVNKPPHYQSEKGIEVIDVIEAFTADLQGIEATDTGNIIKYICRWKHKNGLQDLEKAEWYLKHLIEKVKNPKKEND